MNTTNPRFWLLGGVLVGLAVLALGWTVVISPRMQAVAETREQTVELQDQAVLIRGQAQQLQRQAQDLPEQIRALKRIQSKIPSTVNVPALLREIQRLGRVNDVTIDSLTPGQITVFTMQEQSSNAPAEDAPEATPDQTAPAPQPTPTDLGQGKLPQGVGLSFVPVTVIATGDFQNLVDFTAQLESLQRAYLITGVQLTRATSSEEKLANPLTLVLETRVFVASDRLRNLPDQALEKVGAE
jgi:Tfp pilus assembly protein PilO